MDIKQRSIQITEYILDPKIKGDDVIGGRDRRLYNRVRKALKSAVEESILEERAEIITIVNDVCVHERCSTDCYLTKQIKKRRKNGIGE